ncbi:E3 ubiquitin-protein ligase rnf213-alpha-like isoform X2 [Mytilus californianus]|uniref:E3 ubiquitin-protein ligase rnf213-alpha-like isoform X2 n=1 Tax=Mytilus californianus TaxID=6549 RepID=UPI0022467C90|nr:E3 ubiquitin-protein ligase rnf213-alpha-like isoform X2 [Mytilus californianus]
MYSCPNCGSEVNQGQKFCGECGSKIDVSIYLKTAVSICQKLKSDGTQCGTELTTAVNICPECSPPVKKDDEHTVNVANDGSIQGPTDTASLQGSIKITEEAVSKLDTINDIQSPPDRAQPNPSNMVEGQASTDSSKPNPANMVGGQASADSSQPNPANMVGGQVSTDRAQPNPANMVGGQASTDSSQPNPANMVGGQASADSSQPNPANMVGGQASTDSSQQNPANMVGGQASADSSQPNPANMVGGQASADSSQPCQENMAGGLASTDSNIASQNQQNEAQLMENKINLTQSLTGNQSEKFKSNTESSGPVQPKNANVSEQQQPVFGGAMKDFKKEDVQEGANSELPSDRFQGSFIFPRGQTIESGENKSLREGQVQGNNVHQHKDNWTDSEKNGKLMQNNEAQDQSNKTPTQNNDGSKQQSHEQQQTIGQSQSNDGQRGANGRNQSKDTEEKNRNSGDTGNKENTAGSQDNKTTQDEDSADTSESDSSEEEVQRVQAYKKRKRGKKNKKKKEDKKKERKEESNKRKQKTKDNKNQNENLSENLETDNNGSNTTETHNNTSVAETPGGSKTPGNKREEGRKTFADAAASSKNEPAKSAENKPGSNNFIDVCFHAVISPTIMDPQKDYVVLAFEKYGGGWNSKRYKLKLESPRSDGYTLGTVTVGFPKYMLKGYSSQTFWYNYRVYHGGTSNSSTFEYFYQSGEEMTKIGFFRKLWVPSEYLSRGIHHCYDGIVREDPRLGKGILGSLKESVKNFFGKNQYDKLLQEETEFSILAFQPAWQLKSMQTDGLNGEEMISKMKEINEGLRNVCVKGIKLMFGGAFDSMFSSVLCQHLQAVIHELDVVSGQQLTDEAKGMCLLTAVTLTHIICEYGIKLETKERRMLCEALLPRPDFENKVSQDVEDLKSFLPNQLKNVADSVLKFARGIAFSTSDPSWMFCVPVIHSMFKYSFPFENAPPKVDHAEKTPFWWGVSDFGGDHEYFKGKSNWDRPKDEILEKLKPYFEVDYLLPRTFLASLKLELIHTVVISHYIPPEISLASSIYYLKKNADIGFIKKIIQHVAEQCYNDCPDMSSNGLIKWFMIYKIAADLLAESLRFPQSGNREIHLSAAEVFLTAVDRFHKIQEKLNPNRNEYKELSMTKDEHLTKFHELRLKIVAWLAGEEFTYKELEYMKKWNAALSLKIPNGRIKDSYIKELADSLRSILQKRGSEEELIEIYCLHTDSFEGVVQEILLKVALNAVGRCSHFKFKNIHDERCNLRLGELLSNVFETSWDVKKLDNFHEAVDHAITWGPFPTYMELYCDSPNVLSDYCQGLLEKFKAIILDFIQQLFKGNIVIKDLMNLSNKWNSFQKLLIAIKIDDTDSILEIMNLRIKEYETFKTTFQTVQEFVYYSKHCRADAGLLETKLKEFSNTDMVILNTLVQTRNLEHLKGVEHYKPVVIVFELSSEELEIVPKILKCCKGYLFLRIWEKKGIELEKKTGKLLPVNEIFGKIWQPSFELWTNLCNQLKTGDMLFSDFEKWFKEIAGNTNSLRKEFLNIESFENVENTNWIKERLFQIEKHRDLKSCLYGATAIMEVVTVYELKGNFTQIQDIIGLTGGADTSMRKLDNNLLATCSILGEVTNERAECLKAFIKCKPLVDWLTESMPAGLKELKVFVDLASISAGELPYEIAKVNCLHSATTGYAPLIFNLEKKCDTELFLKKCEEVWKELESNCNLPEKLVRTTQQLEWLQSVKKSHGSVEVTSLAQTEAINGKGIFQIGNLMKTGTLKSPELSDVIELFVPKEEGSEGEKKHYRYEQLHDLKSRLMLVAGKAERGKDDVDRFMWILDSVERLGRFYSKLVTEGCVLFSHWHVKFLCDRECKACAFINFGSEGDRQILKGRVDEANKDVSDIIPQLARFLEQCHNKWLEYIDHTRDKYYCLNNFTIDQMVILQQELVKLGSDKEPSALIYPLLSAVKQGCTKDDLVKAMTAAKSDIDNVKEERKTEMETTDSDQILVDEEPEDVKVQKFIEEMASAGYSPVIAREALKHVESDNIDEGLVWCMTNEDDFKPEEQNIDEAQREEVRQQEVFTGWIKTDQSLASVTKGLVHDLGGATRENAVEKLIKTLEELWKNFLMSVSSSVSDYLSVEHLGMILNRLAEQETFMVERTLLPCFASSEPNLIICPQSDIYNTVLSVYSHEVNRPLPQSDEVLLCTPYTTLDMLETFWRRALFADNSKIYCLVNADLLDYDVSDKGEKSLERHMKSAKSRGIQYRLVVICSSENEYKSRIVAALDKYHKNPLNTEVSAIRKYLLAKLKVDEENNTKPASVVDYERCSVRVVKSWRAGIGKTLYKMRMVESLQQQVPTMENSITIPLHEKALNNDEIMDIFKDEISPPQDYRPRIFHIDISHEVQEGVDAFLFQLLILGCLGHSSGYVWRRSELDYYIIESMPLLAKDTDAKVKEVGKLKCLHHCLDILPYVTCRSPQDSLDILNNTRIPKDHTTHDRLFDRIEFQSATFQRPYQYLKRLDNNQKLDGVDPNKVEGDERNCLTVLISHCGIKDPSWSELYHFVSFLNKQLQDFEVSAFCGLAAMEDLPGFSKFVLRFLIQMSRDFSTRSLEVSEESPIQMLKREINPEEGDDDVVQQYKMRRTWETSPHPYLFFNPDHHSMTFLGFNIEKRTGNLVDLQTGTVLEKGIMQKNLFDALQRNKVNLAENFDALKRSEQITKLCNVMGLDIPHDPDETYELTTDNVKKILAIYMRFKCHIPVIIMGETGCGKTRLIKFMCALQQPPGVKVENMILMKVHGGTKPSDIVKKVQLAEVVAMDNAQKYKNMDTVLFFDEANTTEAIGVIKEIMCDKSLGGKPINLHERLKIVAACNPYRKHSDELIKRLEQAGLGYHVDADKTTDKLGRVPMRRLVYRVQPLPQSMLPLVWDFGQLKTEVEEMYIKQMVRRYVKNGELPDIQGLETVLSKILTVSQDFMRQQKDECSFVSLRDVERVLQVMSWFFRQSNEDQLLFRRMRGELEDSDSETDSDDESMEDVLPPQINEITRSLVLALGVCYHACLKNREEYRDTVAKYFKQPLLLVGGANQIEEEISNCQSVFLDSVNLAPNIAKNQALKENVFMMIVCIELRIPMFLVGKPGSSKSLAKTIVADAMQGNAAQDDLFKNYKQVQMVSYQCSPLSVPEGIVGMFRQCANFQKDKPLDRFVSIVVLDEIGLAEDSPRMPLKTLHPLLEDGCPDDEKPEKYKKVAFIGISNWALDPAKMNRGILVQREVPDITELIESAEGICTTKRQKILKYIKPLIPDLAESYLALFKEASTEMREFFGLRDFYSLLKMLYGFLSRSRKKPSWLQLKHSILRNFGGLENVKPVDIFYDKLSHLVDKDEEPREDDPDCTSAGMIQACLTGDKMSNSETRYMLLLTENYGALTILQQKIFTMENAVVIFGSSFRSDQEYTQVCRNINRIKVCMETGSTVILLNLENLYESLYDALNQYYVEFGDERYVDLGLGTHRVKCRVHRAFRLIVVAEKQIVYDKFPIPLINRLEKHFLSLKTMLTPSQLELTVKLQDWAQQFCEVKVPLDMRYLIQKKETKKIGDVFMGYHDDTCAAIILHVCQELECTDLTIAQMEKQIMRDAETMLLWCATPSAVVDLEDEHFLYTYFLDQHHESLEDYMHYKIVEQELHSIRSQITTNSKLLSVADIEILCKVISIQRKNVELLNLQSFDTEQQFSRQIKAFFDKEDTTEDLLLIIQCDSGDQNNDLIACARNTLQDELQQIHDQALNVHVVFLIQLPGIAGSSFTGFQCGLWHSVHIDDIHPPPLELPSIADMYGMSVSALLDSKGDNLSLRERKPEDLERLQTAEDIDLTDIHLEEKIIRRSFAPKRQFNIEYLIEKCIQPAVGNVKDSESESSRAIERLTLILNCMHNETGEMTILSGIAKHLTCILKEKDKSVQRVVNNWLAREAAKPENVNRAGTFRNFALQCLESKVIPVLAGIIAFIDTNKNLDILANRNQNDWQFNLWSQILNDPELTNLKYSLMVSPKRHKELHEVSVKTTSMDGKLFSASMPFSWIIFGQIEEVLRKTIDAKDIKDSYYDVVMKASEIFQSIPLGRLLDSIEGTYIHDVLKAYLKDFIHMVYPVQSDEECSLMCESVVIGCRHLIHGEFGRMLPSIVGCHMTFIQHDTRFKNFSNIVHVWPGCSQRTLDYQQKQSTAYLVTEEEITLDILALHMLIGKLEPNRDELNMTEGRTKWMRLMCDYRPVVERIFGHFNQELDDKCYQYGERCAKGIEEARYQWTRAVVVKLLIEHVCSTGKEDLDIKRCMTLWGLLRQKADMKTIQSLKKVADFLKLCNKDIVTQCFGQQDKCTQCEMLIEGAPVRLPCDHVICRKCFHGLVATEEFACPNQNCQEIFPNNLDPNTCDTKVETKKYNDFRRRCNSFFMEVVSQLCFADGTPPSKEVIDKLLSYITGHSRTKRAERIVSKELTIFEDSIDPTPVVRSFLLQQLMQTSSDNEIQKYLSAYFTSASDLVKTSGDPHQLVELCLLVLQCMEDSLHQQFDQDEQIAAATQMLREAVPNIASDIEILDKIGHISRVRFSLTVVAKYIHKLYGTSKKSMPDASMRNLFEEAARLCDECNSPWPRRFFVKQLCRQYGIDNYQTIVAKSESGLLRWVNLPELKGRQVEECHDRYIVMGDAYKQLRETLVTTLLSEENETLEKILLNPGKKWQTRIKLSLAIHREICMKNVYDEDRQKLTLKGKTFLSEHIMNHTLVKNKEFTERLLNNSMWKYGGNITKGMDLGEQNIFCLLTHYFTLMTEIPGESTLLTPLKKIALESASMVGSYYPTMPQDDFIELQKALADAKTKNPDDYNLEFYRCPNGHGYVIGNCGNPQEIKTCRGCGEKIGGESHKLVAGNVKGTGADRTETGHTLGRAAKLDPVTGTERRLNRTSLAVLRLLTHISMYLGANINLQAVCQSIKPNIEETEVCCYILEHIDLDLTSLQNILGKNRDDVMVLMHYLLVQIMVSHTAAVVAENHPPDICGLVSKESRSEWEENFAGKFIIPVLQNMENILRDCNQKILNDERLGADPLLQILYETDIPPERQDMLTLHDIPAVWRYRELISVNHLRQNLDTVKIDLPVLQLFLKEEHHLRAIRFIPSIMRLQRMLIQKYGRKLDRAEATILTIDTVKQQMKQDRKLKEFVGLLKEFTEAWNCVKESLETYSCPADGNLLMIDKAYCRSKFTDDTPVSYLIPTYQDAGLCSYVLLFFLLEKQDLFLQSYCSQRKLKEESLPTVHVKDISSAHLISYHPDKDLLPMVLANCNYSFKVGQGTEIEYNYANLERQLMDRFLFSKSFIKGYGEIETIIYRSESTNAIVFKTLCDKIPQERLHHAVQSQICGELRTKSFPELCESLDKLDIAISFLKSVGSDPNSSLADFMSNIKIDNPFPSPKAKQTSKCKHTMSLWILFALERARTLAKYEKKAFESIGETFRTTLTEDQTKIIEEILKSLTVEQISEMVELLFECIVLKIDVPQNRDDEDYFDMSKMNLRDALIGYQDSCPFEGKQQIEETTMNVLGQIPSDIEDPNRVLTAHSVEFWILANKICTSKQQRRH